MKKILDDEKILYFLEGDKIFFFNFFEGSLRNFKKNIFFEGLDGGNFKKIF